MGKNLPHSGFGYGAVGSHEEVVIQFTEDFLGERLLQTPEFIAIQALFFRSMQGIHFSQSVQQSIGKKLRRLRQLDPFNRLMELLQVLQTLASTQEYQLLNAAGQSYDFNQKDEVRLKKIYDYVTEYYQKPVNIREVADLVSLTVPSFCNYFKKICGSLSPISSMNTVSTRPANCYWKAAALPMPATRAALIIFPISPAVSATSKEKARGNTAGFPTGHNPFTLLVAYNDRTGLIPLTSLSWQRHRLPVVSTIIPVHIASHRACIQYPNHGVPR